MLGGQEGEHSKAAKKVEEEGSRVLCPVRLFAAALSISHVGVETLKAGGSAGRRGGRRDCRGVGALKRSGSFVLPTIYLLKMLSVSCFLRILVPVAEGLGTEMRTIHTPRV